MGLPDRALHVFCWAQNRPNLFPEDRTLASTIEVLARAHELKMPFDLDKFISLASRSVYEAMVKGFIKGGNLRLAWKLLTAATDGKRMLDNGVYAKLISELGKNPDKRMLVFPLLEELGKREDLMLTQQDCTAVMKVCVSRYMENRYRDAMAIVWEMEASSCTFDLPSYRVMIKLFVALNDLPRTARYFSKLKEFGFAPSYDIYREVIRVYMASGRIAKCKEICHEAEMAGFVLDEQTRFQLLQL
ncbi:hypothetical protein RD792_007137 [Penstemon davidsonii]|uniref:Pentatricopeptide repeat-containing protein n=1 Tax=Penstemon davidsonii TaxID=160366 RepID=A0ABR0D7E2_9LAMI|nr:hypothetical protein RD792_007137 [Penstemon davidsonii]